MKNPSLLPAVLVLLVAGCENAVTSQQNASPSYPSGTILTVAGMGVAGFLGDGGPAVDAKLDSPRSLYVDGDGNLFIVDTDNLRIRKVTPDGRISTVVGNGDYGTSGDGGAATSASLRSPQSVVKDPQGNLYIADSYSHRIRKVDTDGNISTFAGTGVEDSTGDGSAATAATLKLPVGLAFHNGNLVIADQYANKVRQVDSEGVITTIAGTGEEGFSGDGASATSAKLNHPVKVTYDSFGNLYISDYANQRIRKVDTSGIITTVAGNGTQGTDGDGGAATSAELDYPSEVSVDADQNLYIVEFYGNRVRKVTASGTISTIVGSLLEGSSGDKGPAINARLSFPSGICLDSDGNIFIADTGNAKIRKVLK